jgi:hypothetical protein
MNQHERLTTPDDALDDCVSEQVVPFRKAPLLFIELINPSRRGG